MHISTLASLMLGLMLFQPALAQETKPASPVTPSNIYDYCMPPEIQIAQEQKKDDPKLVAHFICTYYAGMCKDKPDGESCQKALKRYSEVRSTKT